MATTKTKSNATNPKLGSLFYSVKQETPEPVHAAIKGEVPSWINGCLLRNGPGKFELGDQQMNHWFDGLSILHRFNIENGKVTYQSRFQRSDAYVLGMEKNRLVLTEFGTVPYPDPCLNIFQRLMTRFTIPQPSDNYNVNWFQIGEEYFVCMDYGTSFRKIDPNTLETLQKVTLPDTLVLHSATAHPHTTADGTVFNMGSTYGRNHQYNIIKILPPDHGETGNPFQNISISASIKSTLPSMFPSYYHSFGMTENYFVFVEQPMLVNVFKILQAAFLKKPSVSIMEYHPEMHVKFHLVRRDNGKILPIQYEADSFFFFHQINSYEEDGHVVVDLVSQTDADIMKQGFLKDFRSGVPRPVQAEPRRYVLPLDVEGKEMKSNLNGLSYSKAKSTLESSDKIHCTYELICDQATVLPQINYKTHNGKPYRYFYGIAEKDLETLVKCDIKACSSLEWHEDSCFPSEPVYAGRPGATAEDDGVILSAVCDAREGHHPFLLVLDARNFQEIGRAEVPVEVAYGFHGIFVPRN